MNSTLDIIDETTEDAGRAFVARHLDAPEVLMEYAAEGWLSKGVLADLLTSSARDSYIEACIAIEKRYTEACTAAGDPCLEGGCALEGEVCLQPLMRQMTEYHQACAAEWLKLFQDPRNRREDIGTGARI